MYAPPAGLATQLSAADDPGLALWVGLDPVDRDGVGAKAAPLVTCRAVVLTASSVRIPG